MGRYVSYVMPFVDMSPPFVSHILCKPAQPIQSVHTAQSSTYSTKQYSTAQHSTAQHNTAQHNSTLSTNTLNWTDVFLRVLPAFLSIPWVEQSIDQLHSSGICSSRSLAPSLPLGASCQTLASTRQQAPRFASPGDTNQCWTVFSIDSSSSISNSPRPFYCLHGCTCRRAWAPPPDTLAFIVLFPCHWEYPYFPAALTVYGKLPWSIPVVDTPVRSALPGAHSLRPVSCQHRHLLEWSSAHLFAALSPSIVSRTGGVHAQAILRHFGRHVDWAETSAC